MPENLINPFILAGPDYCYVCGKHHVVELYTIYNKPIGFTAILNCKRNIADAVNVPIQYARCRNCGSRFVISWNSDGTLRLIHNNRLIDVFAEQLEDFNIGEQKYAYTNDTAERLSRY